MVEKWKQWQILFSWAPKRLQTVTAATKLEILAPWKKIYDKPRQCIKKQRHHFANKGLHSQSYGFSSSHVWMWELHHKEGWAPQNWCFQTVVLERTLESPLDTKEIKPVNPKGNQSWIFIGKTNAETKARILWPPDVKNWLIGKDLDSGKDWRQKEKGMTEDEMVSLIWWTWVWANFGNWWCTGKPCVLQSMESQRVTHDWASELNCFYLLSLVVNICLNMSS